MFPAGTWAALVAVAMALALLIESAIPRPGSDMVAFWAPSALDLPNAAAIADAIDGRIARAGGFRGWWIVTIQPDAATAPLYRAGAWLVVDAKFMRACARVAAGRTWQET